MGVLGRWKKNSYPSITKLDLQEIEILSIFYPQYEIGGTGLKSTLK